MARFRTTHSKVTLIVITCNSPTNEVDQEVKEEVNKVLQKTMKNRSKTEIILLMGGCNGKEGNDKTGYRKIMGRHGDGDINEHGQYLADVCASNKLVIGGTLFPHKEIHKTT